MERTQKVPPILGCKLNVIKIKTLYYKRCHQQSNYHKQESMYTTSISSIQKTWQLSGREIQENQRLPQHCKMTREKQ